MASVPYTKSVIHTSCQDPEPGCASFVIGLVLGSFNWKSKLSVVLKHFCPRNPFFPFQDFPVFKRRCGMHVLSHPACDSPRQKRQPGFWHNPGLCPVISFAPVLGLFLFTRMLISEPQPRAALWHRRCSGSEDTQVFVRADTIFGTD